MWGRKRNVSGVSSGVDSVVSDPQKRIKELKDDLESLQLYVQEYTSFVPSAICLLSLKGVVIEVNSAFEQMSGYSLFEIANTDMSTYVREKEELTAMIHELEVDDTFSESRELTLETKNGRAVTVKASLAERKDTEGKTIGYFLSFVDITELKAFQDHLEELVEERTKSLELKTKELVESKDALAASFQKVKEEQERTSLIIEYFTDGLLLIDVNGIVRLVNPSATQLLDLQNKNIVGERILSEVGDRLEKLWFFLEGEKDNFEREELDLGDDLFVEVSGVWLPVDTEKQRLIVLRDISREKALDEMKGEFVSVAAHQLRTPLAAIKWAFELAIKELENHPEKVAVIQRGYESSQRMLDLVNSLLNVDRIESGKFDFRFETINLTDLVRNYIEEVVHEEALVHGVRIKFFSNESQDLYISADQEKLKLVLQNLLENALKYTETTGEVRVEVSREGEFAKVSVSDTGIGIPLEAQKHLFEKFYRADNARRLQTDGSGLGLYIVKRVVERHEGAVTFTSKPGAGTTFTITLPLIKKQNGGITTTSTDTTRSVEL